MHSQLHRQMQRFRWMRGHLLCYVFRGTDLWRRNGQCLRVQSGDNNSLRNQLL